MTGATDQIREWIVAELERQRPMLDGARGLSGVKVELFIERDGGLQDIRLQPSTVHKQRRV